MTARNSAGPSRSLFIEPFDLYLFGKGEHWDLYRILGAHPHRQDGETGFRFAVWAPNALEVHLAGDFNEWQWGLCPLYPVGSSGVWAAFVPGFQKGWLYKFGIKASSGRIVYKADPLAFYAEKRPGNASIAWGLSPYAWEDEDWLARQAESSIQKRPVSIYEVHAGSWRQHPRPDKFYNYREIADALAPYARETGFTHIEFMPLAEHPLDLSWGYQTGSYYAPTSRFGTPEDLKYLINRCHLEGIGVILDWVPAHFPKDDWLLGRFDGTALYEHQDSRQGEHPDWGTYIFNVGRNEVKNFLLANALYWIKEFHFDGLRIDAVASMLYLDYSRKNGEWLPNKYGGRENIEAIDFLRTLNTVVHGQYPRAMTIAEESTAWAGVSRPVYTGGLGFTFKWNMGWMHDTLAYMQEDPLYRSYHHNYLTFSLLYAFSENFILPFSHDEAVHGKKALLAKMPGDAWQQQANLRLLYAYMWGHPGKKLIFMGGEFGQWNEWSEERELDWSLLTFPQHSGIKALLEDLNRLLRAYPAMYASDDHWEGFRWVDFSDYASSVISFVRLHKDSVPLLWIFNFTPVPRPKYKLWWQYGAEYQVWREILNTDSAYYGGSNLVGNFGNQKLQYAENGQSFFELALPPLGAVVLSPAEVQTG
ncbi:MAG: 1,4-alpha-glucan branching protein GlgB [Deltaproteobacteria bacterium]|jgi:1,4-alpha-glucan branching enzyme|nr:1,4-alpha-glucan branching protein GlgB [Deltaproteobacteria bacterium]